MQLLPPCMLTCFVTAQACVSGTQCGDECRAGKLLGHRFWFPVAVAVCCLSAGLPLGPRNCRAVLMFQISCHPCPMQLSVGGPFSLALKILLLPQVRAVAEEAIARARRGEGPTLIEAETYRFRGHSLADPDEMREKAEKEYWQVGCSTPALEGCSRCAWRCARLGSTP